MEILVVLLYDYYECYCYKHLVQIIMWTYISISLGYVHWQVKELTYVNVVFSFWGTANLFPKQPHCLYYHQQHILALFLIFLFNGSSSSGYEEIFVSCPRFSFIFSMTKYPNKRNFKREWVPGVVVHTFYSITLEAEASVFLWTWGRPGLHSEYQYSLVYIEGLQRETRVDQEYLAHYSTLSLQESKADIGSSWSHP